MIAEDNVSAFVRGRSDRLIASRKSEMPLWGLFDDLERLSPKIKE
jgi:hypothetical protein